MSNRNRLIFPSLAPLYDVLAPLAETWLRVISGIALMVHGWPKLMDPMGAVGMVERIGFWPSWFWSPALGVGEFFGGLLLVLGLFVRPAAVVASVMLLVTVWFHWVMLDQGYAGAELSLIWSAVTLWFAVRGGGRWSLDRMLGKEF
ncbi:MAG: DoxX family protein [Paracoccaceae bacterium]